MREEIYFWFKKISDIPRGSFNEEEVVLMLKSEADKKGLETKIDEHLNLVIKKKGTPGFEKSKPVILQAHTDMVCEQNEGREHDFKKDPIELIIEGDILRANGTTLGADNGIGVAMVMVAVMSDDIEHPPLEIIFTSAEEVGLVGAAQFRGDYFGVTSRTLINMDSGEEGLLTVSCAGGSRVLMERKLKKENAPSNVSFYKLSIRGLKGGHSGKDIHLGLGNAIDLLHRILYMIAEKTSLQIAHLHGGDQPNAIAREAFAEFCIKDASVEAEVVKTMTASLKKELKGVDDGLEISLDKIESRPVASIEESLEVISMVIHSPVNLMGMSSHLKDLTELSCNMGSIRMKEEGDVVYIFTPRSNIDSKMDMLLARYRSLAKTYHFKMSIQSRYAPWEYVMNSPLQKIAVDTYSKLRGKEMGVHAIHAGLECGAIGKNIGKNMDMISFGPNMYQIHTPNERLEIASTNRTYEYLLELLKALK